MRWRLGNRVPLPPERVVRSCWLSPDGLDHAVHMIADFDVEPPHFGVADDAMLLRLLFVKTGNGVTAED